MNSEGQTDELTAAVTLPGQKKMNIIFIVADDVGYEVPTVDGGQSYSTPTLDKMAREGLQFTQCYSSPLCSPSRTALVTGKYNFRNYFTWGSLPVTEKTFANMLANKGYKTCVAGKWQFDGGDASLKAFGYQNYCIWDPLKASGAEDIHLGSFYKNPKVFQNGAFLPDSVTNGKYGEDMYCQYVKDFIDSNKTKPFFVYYPMVLCHGPYWPTPDDAAYTSFVPDSTYSDTVWYPSMVKYMDKKINEIINKVVADGLANNTLIVFTGDNGTPQQIFSMYRGKLIQGGKSKTTAWGTHVPLIAYGPAKLSKGVVKDLVSFVDFLPTFADVANIPKPTTYGTLDGVSFFNQLTGRATTPRDWIYNYYNANPDEEPANTAIWVQDTTYKLYNGKKTSFYNVKKDVYERTPIESSNLTPQEQRTRTEFQGVIDSIH